ncbi:MAG: bifunctional hydroxymethylpyrimidine kinase/phosphomethylpyrimidine kinase [Rhodobiaceae bacterium]|nr:bifunctional hydroxymethylpyrimidine kinase/phosphomethylpyrimidine kinase [Rhodobiaceae bacterium]
MNAPPVAIIVSSLVSSGRIGARATAFALEQLGIETAIVPTTIMPFHPGHGAAPRYNPPADIFRAQLKALAGHVRGPAIVVTGYLGEAAQAGAIAAFLDEVKPALYLCDPVLGDDDRLYIAEDTAAAIRDTLLPRADIATPNLFELAWLTGMDGETPAAISRAARSLGPREVAVTSVPSMLRGHIGTLLTTADDALMAESRYYADAPHGVGDAFAGLLLGFRLRKGNIFDALPSAVGAISEAIELTARLGLPELALVPARTFLTQPRVPVPTRRIGQ